MVVHTEHGAVESPLLTVREAAALGICSETALRKLIKSGDIPSSRLGTKKIVLTKDALYRYFGLSSDAAKAETTRDGE